MLKQVKSERRTDDEAREALLAVLVRVLDEFRFGLRTLSVDELRDLTCAWRILNEGETPAEVAARVAKLWPGIQTR